MKYERRVSEVVDAERITDDPALSDLARIATWLGGEFSLKSTTYSSVFVSFTVGGFEHFTYPGWWVIKDSDGEISFRHPVDFDLEFTKCAPESADPPPQTEKPAASWNLYPPDIAFHVLFGQ